MGRHAEASKGLGLKALARRINRAMYYVHLRCEPFDDTKYRPLLSESSYPLCDVSEMGFTKRVEHALKSAGIQTSKQVVPAFYSDLARRPGCGMATVKAVATWIKAATGQSLKASSASQPRASRAMRAVGTPSRIETSRDDIQEDETLDQG